MRPISRANPAHLLIALACSLLAAVPAAAQCPYSAIEFVPPGPDPVFSNLGIRSLTSSWDWGHGYGRYDLVAGTLHAASIGDPAGGFGTHVTATDSYTLVGPPGPPIGFSVRLYVNGSAEGRNDGYLPGDMGSVTVSAMLHEYGFATDTAWVTANPGQLLGFSPTLQIPLLQAVGETFTLRMALHSQGGFSTGIVDGKISFLLPAGYAIESCQGFAGSGATPVAKRSWGELKLRYR